MKLEQLFNSLIEKGWKPFWIRWEETRIKIERNEDLDMQIFKLDWIIIEQHHRISWSLRNLTSKESWLWQFCVENKLVNRDWNYTREYVDENKNYILFSYAEWIIAEYYIIESAICDERYLEQFLLENIQLWSED